MLSPVGHSIIAAPGERAKESDLQVCAHCRHIDFVKAGFGPPQVMVMRADGSHYFKPAEKCWNCDQFICLKASCRSQCTPWEKTLDAEEKAARQKARLFCSGDNV